MPLAASSDYGDARFVGVEVLSVTDTEAELERATAGGFDFLVCPLSWPPPQPTATAAAAAAGSAPPPPPPPPPPFARSAFLLSSPAWCNTVVGAVSASVVAADTHAAAPPRVRAAADAALRAELGWAAHLSLQAVMLPCPLPPHGCANTARLVASLLPGMGATALWLRLPLAGSAGGAGGGGGDDGAWGDPWCAWDAFRCHLGPSAAACAAVALDVGPDLPPEPHWRRWLGEPLRCLVLSAACFTTNRRGFPVLPKPHQALVGAALAAGVQLVLAPLPPTPRHADEAGGDAPMAAAGAGAGLPAAAALADAATAAAAPPPRPHPLCREWDYCAFLLARLPGWGGRERAEAPYRDVLQAPLQPLADHLEASTYDTFERDGAKYEAYEAAARGAMAGLLAARAAAEGAAAAAAAPLVVFVLGAGRGPLVRACLRAAASLGADGRPGGAGGAGGVRLALTAVEKNPHAAAQLRLAFDDEGWAAQGVAAIAEGDMRTWVPPPDAGAAAGAGAAPPPPLRAHLLVSELLGSFGDNELSPECLHGAANAGRLLRPGGVCIPAACESWLAPCAAAGLADAVAARAACGGGGPPGAPPPAAGGGGYGAAAWDTPYVVRLHRAALLAPPQRVFRFAHPAPPAGAGGGDPAAAAPGGLAADAEAAAAGADHSRAARLSFDLPPGAPAARVHGLAGFFTATLFGDVVLSTLPGAEAPEGMFSWFPLFLPLRRPPRLGGPGGGEGSQQQQAQQRLVVDVWRCCAPGRVWYEWAASAPGQPGALHNPAGRGSHVSTG